MSFGSDAEARAPEGVFLKSRTHPRAYGNFARLLGRYVRDERLVPLAGGGAPADLAAGRQSRHQGPRRAAARLFRRPRDLRSGDDRRPRDLRGAAAYAVGMRHVFVNGVQVLRDGEHTGATPGRVVRGPGWNRCDATESLATASGRASD